jgi:hypothetical protein
MHRRLIGVAFYENETSSGMVLSCHGPESLASKLIPAVRERWSDASTVVG